MAAIKDYIKDCLCSNPYIGETSVESAANVLRSNVGTWGWHSVPNESIYTEEDTTGVGELTETMDERIERIVKEVVGKLTKKVDPVIAPEIEKYHLKHK